LKTIPTLFISDGAVKFNSEIRKNTNFKSVLTIGKIVSERANDRISEYWA
jgi:hypothetical protein